MKPNDATDSQHAAGRTEDGADHFSSADQIAVPGGPQRPCAVSSLIEKHLHSTLTSVEAGELAQALAEHPALADEFAAATRMDSELRAACKEQAHTALYSRRMERAVEETASPAARRRSWSKPLAAAAGVALLAGGGMAFLEFRQQALARPESPPRGKVSRVPALIAAASTAADAPRGDAASMKRRLRRFVAASAPLRGVPVSQALGSLESQWKSFAHRKAEDKDAIAFTVADAVRKAWQNPDDEPRVSLEIPGISLLTSVELIAAQAGLRAAVTPAGITLEPEKRSGDGMARTWNLPLPAETFTAFLARTGKETERASAQFLQNSLSYGFSLMPLMAQSGPSWMERQTAANYNYYVWDVSNGEPPVLNLPELTGASVNSLTGPHFDFTASFSPPPAAVSFTLPAADNAALGWIVPPGQTIATIDDLIAENLRAGANQTSGFETHYDQTVREVEAHFAQDGQTIDLTLAPEIVDFEGFIDYGEPIQTTGINALGQSEPVVLTDSGITQPVFATRRLPDHPATLTRLLAAHGANSAGVTWDETNGAVTARGTLPELRTASAVLAAVRESAAAAVTYDLRIIEWSDGTAPADSGTDTGALLQLAKRSGSTVVREQATAGVDHGVMLPATDTSSGQPVVVQGGTLVRISPAVLSGTSIRFSAHIERGEEITAGPRESIHTTNSEVLDPQVSLEDGEWLRVNFAARDGVKAATVLVSARAAAHRP